MQIHLSDITDSEGKIIQFSSEVELDKISISDGRVSDIGQISGRTTDCKYRQ